tara:strand:- start:298 stop:528 length:231 start_codon:yes stop_codon:yes gene_type:complete
MSKRKLIKEILEIESDMGFDSDIDRLKELELDDLEEILKGYPESGYASKKKTKTTKVATAKHGGLAKRGYGVARRG